MSKQKISKRKGIHTSGPVFLISESGQVSGAGRTDGSRPHSDRTRNPKQDKTIEEFKEGTLNLKKHLEELEIKLESGWFSNLIGRIRADF